MMGMDCVLNSSKKDNVLDAGRKVCAFLAKSVGTSKEDFPGMLKTKFAEMMSGTLAFFLHGGGSGISYGF